MHNLTEYSTNSSSPGQMMGVSSLQLNIYVISLAFLCVFIVAGNSLVIEAYRTNHRLQSETFMFLVSLAVSDLLVGGIALPLWIYYSSSQWQVGIKGFYVFFVTLDVFSALASIYHLTAISIERYVSITKPVIHRKLTRKFYQRAIIVIWISAALFAIAYPFLVHFGLTEAEKSYSMIVFIMGFVLPLTLIAVTYGLIFKAVKTLGNQQRQRISARTHISSREIGKTLDDEENKDCTPLVIQKNKLCHNEKDVTTSSPQNAKSPRISTAEFRRSTSNHDTSFQEIKTGNGEEKTIEPQNFTNRKSLYIHKERRTAITVVLITGMFFVCWLPFFVVSVISFYCSSCLSLHVNVAQLAMLVKWMHYGNSGVNPVVYSFRNPEFRRTFSKMVKFVFNRRKAPNPTSTTRL